MYKLNYSHHSLRQHINKSFNLFPFFNKVTDTHNYCTDNRLSGVDKLLLYKNHSILLSIWSLRTVSTYLANWLKPTPTECKTATATISYKSSVPQSETMRNLSTLVKSWKSFH